MQSPINLFLGIVFAASGIFSIVFPAQTRQWLIAIQLFGWAKKSVADQLYVSSMWLYGVLFIAIGAFMIYRGVG